MRYEGLFFVLVGLFTLVAAVGDWDWFMTHRKAAFFVSIIGRNGTRFFYAIIGVATVVCGFAFTLGLIK